MTKELQNLNYCEETLSLKTHIEISFLELGKRLQNIRDNRLYEGQWSSFEEYLMEFKNISESTASKLIGIYQKYVVEYGVPVAQLADAGGWSVIAETLPVVKSKKDALYWLNEAKIHPRFLLRKNLTEAKTGIEMRSCKHTDTYTIEICRGCGNRTAL